MIQTNIDTYIKYCVWLLFASISFKEIFLLSFSDCLFIRSFSVSLDCTIYNSTNGLIALLIALSILSVSTTNTVLFSNSPFSSFLDDIQIIMMPVVYNQQKKYILKWK